MRVEIDVKGLDVVVQKLSPDTPLALLEKVVSEAACLVNDRIRQFVPVRTGRLLETTRMEKISPLHIDVVSGGPQAPYAPFVAYGTRPHIIEPVRARALRFEVDGTTVFAKRVMHPGYAGYPYPKLAIEYAIEDFKQFLKEEVAEVFHK
ncbi:MAG: hypothetical protein QXI81_06125 [Nitrososphaerota archaeon]